MSVFTHSMVEGINARMQDAGLVAWPNEKVASEVCAQIADSVDGPEALPEGGLSEKSALYFMQSLKTASDRLVAQGYGPSAEHAMLAKQAASMDLGERAAHVAVACMDKAASEASLTNVEKNTPESATAHNQHAELDQKNRPQGEYNMGMKGVGKTKMPSGGVIGKEMAPTVAPGNSPAISNTAVAQSKVAAIAAFALGKHADQDMNAQDLQGGGSQGGPPDGQDPMSALMAQAQQGGQGGQGPQSGQGPAMDPKAVEQLLAMLEACQQQQGGQPPSQDAGMAMGGLAEQGGQGGQDGQGGPQGHQGMQVMAHILNTSKTAAEIEYKLGMVLAHQEKTASVASPAMQNAVRAALRGRGVEEKSASETFLALLKKGADGSLTDVAKNTPADAAKHDQVAELDLKNRPEDKYNKGVKGVGKTDMQAGKALEERVKNPGVGHKEVATDTVPSRETKSAAEKLSAEENEYLAAFQKVAEVYGPRLPMAISQDEKVAHLKTMLGKSPSEREAYVANLTS